MRAGLFLKTAKSKFYKQILLYGGILLSAFVFSYSFASAASLYLNPTSGNYLVGDLVGVDVMVNSEGGDINAAEGEVYFDPVKLKVSSISKIDSIFDLWVQEPKFDNSLGAINFGGVMLNPGFNGASGKLLTINFRANSSGPAQLIFSSGAVLSNDGYGTNILSSLKGGNYEFGLKTVIPVPSGKPLSPSVPLTALPPLPVIYSETHPDSEKWYSDANPILKWNFPSDTKEARLVLSKRASAVPIVSYIPPISEKELADIGDGVWYLHAVFLNSSGVGPVGSYKFQIDTAPPENFQAKLASSDDMTNPRPEILFDSSDAVSEIDKYEIKIDGGDWLEVSTSSSGRPYALPFLNRGAHIVKVRAIDKAGNITESQNSIEFDVEAIPAPVIEKFAAEVERGAEFYVSGKAEPNHKITISIVDYYAELSKGSLFDSVKSSGGSVIKTVETAADGGGFWEAKISGIKSGKYKAYAVTRDARGAVSRESNIIEFKVKGNILISLIDKLAEILGIIADKLSENFLFGIFVLALIALLILSFKFLLKTTDRFIKKILNLKKCAVIGALARKSEKNLIKKLARMEMDMRDELKFMDKANKRRGLGPEEKYLVKKLKRYLKVLEDFNSFYSDSDKNNDD